MKNKLNLKEIYREMELELISSMKRTLSRHLKEEEKTGFNFTQWQAETLKEMKRFQHSNKSIVGSYTKGLSKDISKQLQNELKQGSRRELKKYKKVMGDKYKGNINLSHSFFKLNDKKLDGLIQEIQNGTQNANYGALRMLDDQYRKVISKVVMFSNHGVVSPTKAIDMATKDFLNAGINCIEYKNGRRVNTADYCDMAVRTANTRAQLIGEGQFRQEIGEHLVRPTRHNTACEKCAKWEGKVLIDDVYSGGSKKDGKYPLLSEAMAQGFFHPRCEHSLPTYYKDMDDIEFDEHGPTEKTMQQYQEKLNWINNNIHRCERLITGSLDEDNIRLYEDQKQHWERKKELNEVVKNTRMMISETFYERTKGAKINSIKEKHSCFDLETGNISLGTLSDEYSLIHELAHRLQWNFTKEEQIVYDKIILNKFKKYTRKDFMKIRSKAGGKYYVLKDYSDFISRYQTRIYNGGFNLLGKLNLEYAQEYFSEGVKYYYKNPKLLEKKDKVLYSFIKKVIDKK